MGTCSRCGKHGLFLRVDKVTGLCENCVEYERKMDVALAGKKAELANLELQIGSLQEKAREAEGKLDGLKNKVTRLKPLAKSILEANQLMFDSSDEAVRRIQGMGSMSCFRSGISTA